MPHCFITSFLDVDWSGGWEQTRQKWATEIPERLIDLVKKNKGIQSPAPPFSTWACGIEAVTVKSCG